MSEMNMASAQVLDAIEETRKSMSSPGVDLDSVPYKAYEFVAQSMALAVQDATDNLRNVSTISTTAIGVAMAQLMSSGDVKTWGPIIAAAQGLVKASADDLLKIGDNAITVLRDFAPVQQLEKAESP